MEQYEKKIGLKTMWQTLVRKWKTILLVFAPVSIATLIITQFVMVKTYSSEVTFLSNSSLDNARYATASSIIQNETTINKTVENLSNLENPITISAVDILSGISIPSYKSSTPYIVVSFTNKNKNVVKPVLSELSKAALEALKSTSSFSGMSISSSASDAKHASKDTTYLLIGLAAGAVLALGLAFIDEIISDEVYDSDDVKYLGSPAFEITASK